jgi:hypothetical protein
MAHITMSRLPGPCASLLVHDVGLAHGSARRDEPAEVGGTHRSICCIGAGQDGAYHIWGGGARRFGHQRRRTPLVLQCTAFVPSVAANSELGASCAPPVHRIDLHSGDLQLQPSPTDNSSVSAHMSQDGSCDPMPAKERCLDLDVTRMHHLALGITTLRILVSRQPAAKSGKGVPVQHTLGRREPWQLVNPAINCLSSRGLGPACELTCPQ